MLIYKILLPAEWTAFEAAGRFDGSPFDVESGFVHCSSRAQVAATARRFFTDVPRFVVVALDTEVIDTGAAGGTVRWEDDPDGRFPHVYGPLPGAAVVATYEVDGAGGVERALPPEHVAIVTGANHGIGAATARALAARRCAVLCTYLRVRDAEDPATPERYRINRARGADELVARIERDGGRALAVEADLRDPRAAVRLFDLAERTWGPVDILINNATGWVADTFTATREDRHGRGLTPVGAQTWAQQFGVDAMAPALLIAELARRHLERGATWGRIVGLTSGGPDGFPQEVSYGAAKAAQENYTKAAAAELAPYGITANMVHPPVTDTGWVNDSVRAWAASGGTHVATPEQVAEVIAYLASDAAELLSGNVIRMR